jgi:hypothetical protein
MEHFKIYWHLLDAFYPAYEKNQEDSENGHKFCKDVT